MRWSRLANQDAADKPNGRLTVLCYKRHRAAEPTGKSRAVTKIHVHSSLSGGTLLGPSKKK